MILYILFLLFYASSLTVSMAQQHDFVPEWSKKVIWYQIFPDRFRNGDAGNNPAVEDIRGAYPHDAESPWQVHPWGSDWYELQPYEKQNGKDIWFNIQRRRYGGDLQGIIDKLPYLNSLGIGAIYLNPVFQSPSHHKYDGATFHHIDPTFGPDPDGDQKLIAAENPLDPKTWVWTSADKMMLELINKIHSLGMRVIFDGVFNHMGINSFAFQDVVRNQQNSSYKDWFTITSWRDEIKGTEFKYNGWWGVKELPELRQDEYGITGAPKDYIYTITRRWMDPDGDGNPADGIDGWRLDVAFCIKHQFWKDWRKHVKSINPEAYLTAEVIDTIDAVQPYLQGDEFDAVMNYNFAFTSADYFFARKHKISTSDFDRMLAELRNAFPECVGYVQQNLFGSHDANRIGSHIINADLGSYRNFNQYFQLSKGSNPDYNVRKPTDEEYRLQMLFAIFQMTYVGAPMLYYGDEIGMWGSNDPDCRKPMLWDDIVYDDEVFLPNQKKRHPDSVSPNHDLLNHYQKLISIRNNSEILQTGKFKSIVVDDVDNIFVFRRSIGDAGILVGLNNGKLPYLLPLPAGTKYKDLLSGNVFQTKADIPALWGVILEEIP